MKKNFRVGAMPRISSVSNEAKVDNVHFRAQDFSATRHSKAGKDTLKKIRRIREKRAKKTLRVITRH